MTSLPDTRRVKNSSSTQVFQSDDLHLNLVSNSGTNHTTPTTPPIYTNDPIPQSKQIFFTGSFLSFIIIDTLSRNYRIWRRQERGRHGRQEMAGRHAQGGTRGFASFSLHVAYDMQLSRDMSFSDQEFSHLRHISSHTRIAFPLSSSLVSRIFDSFPPLPESSSLDRCALPTHTPVGRVRVFASDRKG